MPADRFGRVYLPPVMDLAQSQHIILTKPSRTAQDVMNLGRTIYPIAVADNAASSPYSVLEALLLFCHGIMLSGAGILMPA